MRSCARWQHSQLPAAGRSVLQESFGQPHRRSAASLVTKNCLTTATSARRGLTVWEWERSLTVWKGKDKVFSFIGCYQSSSKRALDPLIVTAVRDGTLERHIETQEHGRQGRKAG
jgi:hypothetical protein